MSNHTTPKNISTTPPSTSASRDSQMAKMRSADQKDSQHFQQMLKQQQQKEKALGAVIKEAPLLTEGNIPTAQGISGLPIPAQLSALADATHMNVNIASASSLQQLIDTIVESMAISTNKGNNHEMRIVLKEDILPNTEVRINASNHQLIVQFITASGIANKWLDQRLFTMQTALERTLNRPIEISLLFRPQDQDGSSSQERPAS